MKEARESAIVSRAGLMAAGGLVGLTLLAVFALPRAAPDRPAGIEQQRLLRFADRDDGAVLVTDATTGGAVETIIGPNGFLRGTLSGLARIRHTERIGAGPPFRLTLYRDHRLVLDDPATGQTIELEAFGPTNLGVFTQLLP